jgi:uncharacterized protein (TIGR02246 family)
MLVAHLLLVNAAVAAGRDTLLPLTDPAAAETLVEDVEKIHDELRALRVAMEQALNTRDLDALLANVDEHVVFTTMNGDVVVGRRGVADYFRRMLEGPSAVVESIRAEFVPEALSLLYGLDTAISWGHTKDHYVLRNGSELEVSARWSATMVNEEGRWLVASFHYSTNMFDNPVLTTQRRILLIGGVAGAVVALVAGFVIGRRSGRAARA